MFGNLSVNWPKLLGFYQNGFTTFLCVRIRNVIGIIFNTKKSTVILNCVLDTFNAVDST